MIAAGNASRMWGGPGVQVLKDMCDNYADQITEYDTYTADICFAEILLSNNLDYDAMQSVVRRVDIGRNPEFPLAAAMARHLEYHQRGNVYDFASAKAAQMAYIRTLRNPSSLDLWLHKQFSRTFSRGDERAKDAHDDATFSMVDAAYATLERDPYNPTAISLLQSYAGYQGDGHTIVPQAEYQRDLLARQLMIQPYDTDAWTQMAGYFPRPGAAPDADDMALPDPFLENAIVMDYHSAHSVMHALERKLFQVGTVDALLEIDGISNEVAQDAHAAAQCRIIRLHRLAEYICDNGGDDEHGTCGYITEPTQRLSSLLSAASVNPACDTQSNAAIMSLAFAYHDIDLNQYILDDPRPAE
ncbi:hypothetical protein [Yoonia sp. 208BN28-4]|uniref:hypothetical protein n=1 Tax=Yoonia sp. 208BN28-4 TaxID=3126505 RepID=UPI00309B736A